jgi:hypothetical protein
MQVFGRRMAGLLCRRVFLRKIRAEKKFAKISV